MTVAHARKEAQQHIAEELREADGKQAISQEQEGAETHAEAVAILSDSQIWPPALVWHEYQRQQAQQTQQKTLTPAETLPSAPSPPPTATAQQSVLSLLLNAAGAKTGTAQSSSSSSSSSSSVSSLSSSSSSSFSTSAASSAAAQTETSTGLTCGYLGDELREGACRFGSACACVIYTSPLRMTCLVFA